MNTYYLDQAIKEIETVLKGLTGDSIESMRLERARVLLNHVKRQSSYEDETENYLD